MNEPLDPAAEPDLVLGPLRIWIARRQFPEHEDYWDRNWLLVEARCSSPDSRARVGGPLIHLSDLRGWLEELRRLSTSIEGEAILDCIEPEVAATIRLDKLGRGTLVVAFRRYGFENHEWSIEIDQSYLSGWISSIERVLETYPIRGKP